MAIKRLFLLTALFTALISATSAQEIIVGADFTTRFDNKEFASCKFGESATLFSARLTPRVGVQWQEKNRLIFGVDLLQDFGAKSKFLTDVKPIMYYQFTTKKVQVNAGIFDRKELVGEYPRSMFRSSYLFYENRLMGFLGRYTSEARRKSYVEFALSWEGMYSAESREKFRIISAGRYTARSLYFGYTLTLFHFANSVSEKGVSDNMMINPFVGVEVEGKYTFNAKATLMLAPQRVRDFDTGWEMPCGGQLDLSVSRWGLTLENSLYVGENLQPYYGLYGAEFYAGDPFYSTTEKIYNRTWLGYGRKFFKNTLNVEAGMALHYDGVGMGTHQLVKVSVNIDKLFNISGKKK